MESESSLVYDVGILIDILSEMVTEYIGNPNTETNKNENISSSGVMVEK